MADCIFCMIGKREIPSNVVYEDDKLICFHDLEPQAPVHVLVIPKKHIESLDDVKDEDPGIDGTYNGNYQRDSGSAGSGKRIQSGQQQR